MFVAFNAFLVWGIYGHTNQLHKVLSCIVRCNNLLCCKHLMSPYNSFVILSQFCSISNVRHICELLTFLYYMNSFQVVYFILPIIQYNECHCSCMFINASVPYVFVNVHLYMFFFCCTFVWSTIYKVNGQWCRCAVNQ